MLTNGRVEVQTYAQLLPRGKSIALREDGGGVGSANFLAWTEAFTASVRDLSANGGHVLLIYDSYAAHMSMRVLEIFRRDRIVVYAIPAHTSGKKQPLDVVVFDVYKQELDDSILRALRPDEQ